VRFFANILVPKITSCVLGLKFFWHQNSGEKSARKMLLKLTPGYPTGNGVHGSEK